MQVGRLARAPGDRHNVRQRTSPPWSTAPHIRLYRAVSCAACPNAHTCVGANAREPRDCRLIETHHCFNGMGTSSCASHRDPASTNEKRAADPRGPFPAPTLKWIGTRLPVENIHNRSRMRGLSRTAFGATRNAARIDPMKLQRQAQVEDVRTSGCTFTVRVCCSRVRDCLNV
jgi:hypothetical protein